MTFDESLNTCFNKFTTFEGRASRSEYWWFWLFTFAVSYVPFVGWIASLACLIPIIAAGVRRMHDTNHSGWWLLCPIYNILLAATAGNPEANEYGNPPVE